MKKGHKDLWYNTKFDIRVRGDLVQRTRKHKPTLGDILLAIQDNGKRLDAIENRLGKVEKRLDKVEKRLDKVEKRLDKVEKRLDKVEKRLDKVENRLDKIENRIDNIVIKNKLTE